jgi:hypothetical protein
MFKNFFVVNNSWTNGARVIVPDKLFQLSLIFEIKVRVNKTGVPLSASHYSYSSVLNRYNSLLARNKNCSLIRINQLLFLSQGGDIYNLAIT